MNTTNYAIDLALTPTTFDLWHVCLLGIVALLALLLIMVLFFWAFSLSRSRKQMAAPVTPEVIVKEIPVERIIEIEKIVEVEKIIEAPAPKPVILKEASSDAALQLLGLFQKEARFIDFIQEELTAYSDADVGVAARVVHEGCHKVMKSHFKLSPIRPETEGTKLTLQKSFDATKVRLTGNVVGNAPFSGELIHRGWQVSETNLPKLTESYNVNILTAAEVEL
ncbi:MAG: DUF2760 domain-containing protein [Methylococcales bacterium]|nr:DUF2760 domain-containing protein [Methylococcales bacterium]